MWYRLAQQQIGYKVVAWDGKNAISIYDKRTVYSLVKGSIARNLYLGTTREFCIDYYSLTTDREELLLAYSYLPEDVISGGGPNSEVQVRKATLEGYEKL